MLLESVAEIVGVERLTRSGQFGDDTSTDFAELFGRSFGAALHALIAQTSGEVDGELVGHASSPSKRQLMGTPSAFARRATASASGTCLPVSALMMVRRWTSARSASCCCVRPAPARASRSFWP